MRYEQFWPGDTVVTIVEYDGVPVGSIARVSTRWIGTGYLVKLPDGTFRWMDSSELRSIDPAKHRLEVGDIGVVTSDAHQHDFAKVGDWFQIHKVIYDIDYYQLAINNEIHWLAGFQLGRYIPPATP